MEGLAMKTIALRKIGNSQGVILDKTILDLVGAGEENVVFELRLKGNEISLRPVDRAEQKKRIREASKAVQRDQRPILKKLAE
jgi:antitoxin component of MazEF toxin-antitoxin module